jgi:hypothetical protein
MGQMVLHGAKVSEAVDDRCTFHLQRILWAEIKEGSMAATKDRWKRVPFISGVPTPFAATFSREDFEKIRVGVVPEIMEDKWFVYFEEPHLFMHRSWTGLPVYRLTLAVHGDGASVVEALCVAEALGEYDSEYHANLLDFLISSLLLGKAKPFPVPAGTRKSKTGLLQHAIAGTGFAQTHLKGRRRMVRRWWVLWR